MTRWKLYRLIHDINKQLENLQEQTSTLVQMKQAIKRELRNY